MILAACGGRGNGDKDAEGLARAESREGSEKWEMGRVDKKEGGWGGVDGNGEGETGRGNLEGGNGEGEMERVAMGKWGEDEKGAVGRGERGKRWGGGEEGARRRGDFTDGYDGMPGWT